MNYRLPKLRRNAARCINCNTTIESKHVHDFQWCPCKTIFVDGGLEHARRGGNLDMLDEMNEYEAT